MKIINSKDSLRRPKFLRNKTNIFLIFVMVLINISNWILLYVKFKPQSNPIYLHYNIYFGIDLIGPWYQIYIIPVIGLVIIIVNSLFSILLYKKEKIVSIIIIGVTIFMLLIMLFSSFLISRQNI